MDEIATAEYGIPGILLMENAALQIAAKACEMLSQDKTKRVVAVTGKGNNGGDAFAAARHLHQWGYPISVISLVPPGCVTGDALTYLQILDKLGIEISYIDDEAFLRETLVKLSAPDLILDGLFGTGIHGEITGVFAAAIEAINDSSARVLSIDIPSGINGKTGQVCGVAVKADETVTFSLSKPGLWQYPGRLHTGKITVAEIGIPAGAAEMADLSGELLEPSTLSGLLPKRAADGHKGTFGKVLIITGSTGMTGAGTLAARAAFKAGSGMVYLAVPASLSFIYNITIPEAIVAPQADKDGVILEDNLESLLKLAASMDAAVIGPGLSAKPAVAQWVNSFVKNCRVPMVIDADALNVLDPKTLGRTNAPVVITPHPGEFSRLTGNTVEELQKDRVENALKFSREYNATVALKGAGTVIACPDGSYKINTSGHSNLAVAGSGDVLAGITGSLIGQGIPHQQALALAVFIHGRCGEVLAGEADRAGFTAGEIVSVIPAVISDLRHPQACIGGIPRTNLGTCP
jgi:NAD(P)H-hydrate epimerase